MVPFVMDNYGSLRNTSNSCQLNYAHDGKVTRSKITNAFSPRRIHQYIRIVSGVRPVFTTMDTTYTMKQIFDYFG